MKIVILDGYTTNPGDLDWEGFKSLGELAVYDRTPISEVYNRANDAEIVITNKTVLNGDMIESLKKLKYIGLLSTGFNVVDLKACEKRNIPVCNIPSYSTDSVAQMTFALLLEITNAVAIHSDSVKNLDWSKSEHFCYSLTELTELAGKTFGIIGYGQIGKAVSKIAQAFKMRVIANKRNLDKNEKYDIEMLSLLEVFKQSDIISLHCPLNDSNAGFINQENISKMKDGVIIINTSRGGLINEQDLATALYNGKVSAFAADVLSTEPPKFDNPLFNTPNTFITPHIAWASKSARSRLMNIAVNNLKSFLEGKIVNCVY